MATLILFIIVLLALVVGTRVDVPGVREQAFRANIAPLLGLALSSAPGIIGSFLGNRASRGDSRRARELSQKSLDTANKATQGAIHQFDLSGPLRDAFRFGALNTADPTNPFTRDLFGGFSQFLNFENANPNVGPGEVGDTPVGSGFSGPPRLPSNPLPGENATGIARGLRNMVLGSRGEGPLAGGVRPGVRQAGDLFRRAGAR